MAYKLRLFDDCCHIWVSENTGATFTEGCTPGGPSTPAPNDPGLDPHGVGTLLDQWSDCQMAINDGDYETVVGFDLDYQNRFGIVGISPDRGLNGTWTLSDPSPGQTAFNDDFDNYQQYIRGACSGNAETILCCTRFAGGTSAVDFRPRITRNGGATWNDVGGGLPASTVWTHAAFGSTASQVMYLKPLGDFLWKSTDWGVTWTQLASGPAYFGESTDEGKMRLRCSADGQTVFMVSGATAIGWLSKNGGASWTSIDFGALFDTPGLFDAFADCGVSPDGNALIACFEQGINGGFWPAVFVSTDGGTSFVNRSAGIQYPASVGPPTGGAPGTNMTGCGQCNVAPDGLGLVVTFNFYGDDGPEFPDGLTGKILYANVSTDAGVTWSLSTIQADPYEESSVLGLFTGVYIVEDADSSSSGCPSSGFDLVYPPCVTAWTQCVKIQHRDGVSFRFTSLDQDIEFRGETYVTCGGLDPSATQITAQLGEIGSTELGGLIVATGVKETELYGGLFDDAFVEIWLVPFDAAGDASSGDGEPPRRLAAGWAGKVSHSTRGYRMEVLGPGARLDQRPIVQVYSPQCRWVFGDERCTIDIESLAITGSVTSGINRGSILATLGDALSSGTGAPASSGSLPAQFQNGKVRWLTGVNAGQVTEVKSVDFDTGSIILWALTCFVPEVGDTFDLLPGCAQDFATCKEVYDNVLNFGGFPSVPGRDAIMKSPDAKNG